MTDDFRLCYVDGPWAWFTTAALVDQWGDDWNDAPYEHNAGTPYAWHEEQRRQDGSRVPRYELLKVAWDGPLETPDAWHLNSPYSVEQINKGAVPWLVTARYTTGSAVSIPAGTSLPEFIRLVEEAGGIVYVQNGTGVLSS